MQKVKNMFMLFSHATHMLRTLTKGEFMSIGKKLGISAGWLSVYALLVGLIFDVRHIGTTWTNNAGGIRVLVLALLSVSTLIPLGLAVSAWFDRPKCLYTKPR